MKIPFWRKSIFQDKNLFQREEIPAWSQLSFGFKHREEYKERQKWTKTQNVLRSDPKIAICRVSGLLGQSAMSSWLKKNESDRKIERLIFEGLFIKSWLTYSAFVRACGARTSTQATALSAKNSNVSPLSHTSCLLDLPYGTSRKHYHLIAHCSSPLGTSRTDSIPSVNHRLFHPDV